MKPIFKYLNEVLIEWNKSSIENNENDIIKDIDFTVPIDKLYDLPEDKLYSLLNTNYKSSGYSPYKWTIEIQNFKSIQQAQSIGVWETYVKLKSMNSVESVNEHIKNNMLKLCSKKNHVPGRLILLYIIFSKYILNCKDIPEKYTNRDLFYYFIFYYLISDIEIKLTWAENPGWWDEETETYNDDPWLFSDQWFYKNNKWICKGNGNLLDLIVNSKDTMSVWKMLDYMLIIKKIMAPLTWQGNRPGSKKYIPGISEYTFPNDIVLGIDLELQNDKHLNVYNDIYSYFNPSTDPKKGAVWNTEFHNYMQDVWEDKIYDFIKQNPL